MSTQTHSKPPCDGCALRLAPSTIQGPFKRARFVWLRRHWPVCMVVAGALLAWVVMIAVLCLVLWFLGFGYWGHSYG
jgi:hypothetical protein